MAGVRRTSDLGTQGVANVKDGSITTTDLGGVLQGPFGFLGGPFSEDCLLVSGGYGDSIHSLGPVTIDSTLVVNTTSTSGIRFGSGTAPARLWSTTGDNFNLRTYTNTPNPNFSLGVGNGSGGDSHIPIYWESGTLTLRGSGTSTTGMTINSSGVVAQPNHPRAMARRSGDLTGYNPSSQTNPIVFNSVDYNVGNHYNSSTGLFTCPVAGSYLIAAGIYASNTVSQIWPIVNGGRQQSFVLEAAGNWNNLAGMTVMNLAANDTVGVLAWFNGAVTTIYANIYHTFFRVHLVA